GRIMELWQSEFFCRKDSKQIYSEHQQMKVKHVIYPVLLFFLTSPVVLAQPLLERIQLLKDMWRYDEMVKLLKLS
ncbi:MAG TPA: hypothetical protein PLU97_03800, partial [Candidatus Cryptobacteroides sp.]|nr:hypothetical protein [Candidatus Cryptobacteroides sp.]